MMILMRRALASIGVALVMGACGEAPLARAGTGIQGMVQVGPTCPVERINSPCPPRPMKATVLVQDASGHEVMRFTSGSDGRFKVDLPAGTYTLLGLPPAGQSLPRPIPSAVSVRQGVYTTVVVQYDSGIR